MPSPTCVVCGRGSVIEYNEVEYCVNCLRTTLREQAMKEATKPPVYHVKTHGEASF